MERSAWPENLSSSRKRAIKELLHAQKPTKKLRDLFDAHSQAGNNTGQPLFSEDLVGNVLRSFSNTLSLSSSAQSDDVLQVPTNACVRSEVSEGSESIHNPVPRKTLDTWTRLGQNLIDDGHQWRTYDQKSILNSKSRRKTLDTRTRLDHNLIDDGHQWRKYGQKAILNSEFPWILARTMAINVLDPTISLKTLDTRTRLDWNLIDDGHQWRTYNKKSLLNFELARKTSDVWTVEMSDLIDDGYLWRKYGQRPILNSKFPRKYFRCVHQIDQGCQAAKLVQRTSHDPRLFLITYRGRHTCKIIRKSPPLILDSPSPRDDSSPLSFNTSVIAEQADDDNNNPIFFDFLSVNQEQKLPSEDDLNPHGHSHDHNSNTNNNQSA